MANLGFRHHSLASTVSHEPCANGDALSKNVEDLQRRVAPAQGIERNLSMILCFTEGVHSSAAMFPHVDVC